LQLDNRQDNVFVTVLVSVQYLVVKEKMYVNSTAAIPSPRCMMQQLASDR
jgi:hypothetical protein